MTSFGNYPLNQKSFDSDFTVSSYRELIAIAKQKYTFASFANIPWGQKFVLWRHDCDYSLNRAFALACIEAEQGVKATYFLNLHSEFYNIFEKKQHCLVQNILSMGHEIGLHFDAAFNTFNNEAELSDQVSTEAAILEKLYGVKPSTFSFHNPTSFHLSCDKEKYGELVNCYSLKFKAIPYCSDSNGYWRFRRLKDVLNEAKETHLQILTHPGWWQETAMPPRQRIFRSAYGRAAATMRLYDSGLESYNRLNLAGSASSLHFLKQLNFKLFMLYEYLWNTGNLKTLFSELWSLHKQQLKQLSKAEILGQLKVPLIEMNIFFEDPTIRIDESKLFKSVFGKDCLTITNIDESTYRELQKLRKMLKNNCDLVQAKMLEDGCTNLLKIIEMLAFWGRNQAVNFDGVNSLESIKTTLCKTQDDNHLKLKKKTTGNKIIKEKWVQIKTESLQIERGG